MQEGTGEGGGGGWIGDLGLVVQERGRSRGGEEGDLAGSLTSES